MEEEEAADKAEVEEKEVEEREEAEEDEGEEEVGAAGFVCSTAAYVSRNDFRGG